MKRIALALIVLVFGACEIEPVVAPPITGDTTPPVSSIGDDKNLFEHKNCYPGPWGCALCFAEKVVAPGHSPNTDETLWDEPPPLPLPTDPYGCPWGDDADTRWDWF